MCIKIFWPTIVYSGRNFLDNSLVKQEVTHTSTVPDMHQIFICAPRILWSYWQWNSI